MNASQLAQELWDLRQLAYTLGAPREHGYQSNIKWTHWPFKTVRRRVVWEHCRTRATIRVGNEGVRIVGPADDVAKWVQVALDLLDG